MSEIISKSSTCTSQLVPAPMATLKSASSVIAPLIAHMINLCFSLGTVPPSLKIAAVTPILKKPGLDPFSLAKYRPISNVPFLAKVMERVVACSTYSHIRSDHPQPWF